MLGKTKRGAGRIRGVESRRGVAIIPTLLVVSGLGIFALALLTAGLSTKRSVNHQADDYRLSSAVESVATLTTETIWSGFLASGGGAAGDITSFRNYLTSIGIPNDTETGQPLATDGVSMLGELDLAQKDGVANFNDVNIDLVQIVRRDIGLATDSSASTQLYLTVSATTNRGAGMVNPVLDRAIQQVYTVEPADFDGFDYAVLANNINCIFCHTNVDNVERWYGTDPNGQYDRVRVGSLETLMIRHEADGLTGTINDMDTDSFVAGTVYTRGPITDHNGAVLSNWNDLTFLGYEFDDQTGKIVVDGFGDLSLDPFSPAGTPLAPLENLYLDYPTEYKDMVDGGLPVGFPAPIPDDGGIDPSTGLPSGVGAGNGYVDDNEFYATALQADGAITAGIITVNDGTDPVDSAGEWAAAILTGNSPSIQQSVGGNVILTGTQANPITIDGTVAIDGDLVINGYVKGEGTLIVRGNIYIPTDMQYLDGVDNEGNRTFGVAQNNVENTLGLAAGGNIVVGDYLAPSSMFTGTPLPTDYVTGDSDDDWTFALAEMALFNRAEWAKTQPKLPSYPGEADLDPSLWTMPNPDYVPGYTPRYYHYGDGDTVPIYNKGNIYWDPATGTWEGDAEVPLSWDASKLTFADPDDPTQPLLYDGAGNPIATLSQISPTGGWFDEGWYKAALEHFEANVHQYASPMTIDGLLYTNNSIFSITDRESTAFGQLLVNGSLVAADLGILAPGIYNILGSAPNVSPLSNYAIGLQLNYDARVKKMLNVKNPWQVELKRTFWNPTANVL